MECREVRQLAEALVSQQLLVETTEAVVAHLEGCPACRAEIEGLRRLRTATRSAFTRSAELAVRPEFAADLASRLQATASARKPLRLSRRHWLTLAAGLVGGVAWGWRDWSKSRGSALLDAAVGDHRFCALTFKLAEKPISLTEAARLHGEVYRAFENVEPSTSALSGGPLRILERHSCVFDDRRFVHLVLRYKGEKVSLLATALPAGGPSSDAALPDAVADGFHVTSYREARHAVYFVSSLNDADVREVAQAMNGPVARALAG